MDSGLEGRTEIEGLTGIVSQVEIKSSTVVDGPQFSILVDDEPRKGEPVAFSEHLVQLLETEKPASCPAILVLNALLLHELVLLEIVRYAGQVISHEGLTVMEDFGRFNADTDGLWLQYMGAVDCSDDREAADKSLSK